MSSDDRRWFALARSQMLFVISLSLGGVGLAVMAISYFGGF